MRRYLRTTRVSQCSLQFREEGCGTINRPVGPLIRTRGPRFPEWSHLWMRRRCVGAEAFPVDVIWYLHRRVRRTGLKSQLDVAAQDGFPPRVGGPARIGSHSIATSGL